MSQCSFLFVEFSLFFPFVVLSLEQMLNRVQLRKLTFVFCNIDERRSFEFDRSGNDAFGKKEHAEETRWARRHVSKRTQKRNSSMLFDFLI